MIIGDHSKHLTRSQMWWSAAHPNLSQADHYGTKVAHYIHVNYLHMKYTYYLEDTHYSSSLHKYVIITLKYVEPQDEQQSRVNKWIVCINLL